MFRYPDLSASKLAITYANFKPESSPSDRLDSDSDEFNGIRWSSVSSRAADCSSEQALS